MFEMFASKVPFSMMVKIMIPYLYKIYVSVL